MFGSEAEQKRHELDRLIPTVMEPTCKLRFVIKNIPVPMQGTEKMNQSVRVLQQWWRDINTHEGEWRDVEFEGELTEK